MNNVDVRMATEDDLPSILNLYAQPGIDDGAVLSVEAARLLFRRIGSYPRYFVFVATADNEVVGSFALLIMDNLGHLGAPSGIIEDVVVSPDLHGLGVGKKMMQHAALTCRQHNCYKIVLSANKKRKNAHAFYESLGFEKHGYSFVMDGT